MSASKITELLSVRHSKDVFVPQCKDGPTHGTSHLRMDAWAMSRSWVRPDTFGYEIKVSRSDWSQDSKWHRYLPYCSHFLFVTPHGLVQPEEVPAPAGLLWASKNFARLFLKKKPDPREVTIPEDVWRYILMCRAKIDAEHPGMDREERIRRAKERWKADQEGHRLGVVIRYDTRKRIDDAMSENRRLLARIEELEAIQSALQELGIDPGSARKWRGIREDLASNLRWQLTPEIAAVDNMIDRLGAIRRSMEERCSTAPPSTPSG